MQNQVPVTIDFMSCPLRPFLGPQMGGFTGFTPKIKVRHSTALWISLEKSKFYIVDEFISRGPGKFEKHCHALALLPPNIFCMEVSLKLEYVSVAQGTAKVQFIKVGEIGFIE